MADKSFDLNDIFPGLQTIYKATVKTNVSFLVFFSFVALLPYSIRCLAAAEKSFPATFPSHLLITCLEVSYIELISCLFHLLGFERKEGEARGEVYPQRKEGDR